MEGVEQFVYLILLLSFGIFINLPEHAGLKILGRFIQGIPICGFTTMLVPKFIYETAPA